MKAGRKKAVKKPVRATAKPKPVIPYHRRKAPSGSFSVSVEKTWRYADRKPVKDKQNRIIPIRSINPHLVLRDASGEARATLQFKLLEWDINDIFNIKKIKIEIPEYAPIRESVVCLKCGESIMKAKEIQDHDKVYCRDCRNSDFFQLDGTGISVRK